MNDELIYAARIGDIDRCQKLIEGGVDVNEQDAFGRTPLYVAAKNGFVAICELLIVRGANIHKNTVYYETPLHKAVQHGHIHVCQLLLNNGAVINYKNVVDIIPPLWYAVVLNSPEVCQLLIDRGADVNVIDVRGRTPLHFAGLYGDNPSTIIELLLEHMEVWDIVDYKGKTAEDIVKDDHKPLFKARRMKVIHDVSIVPDELCRLIGAYM